MANHAFRAVMLCNHAAVLCKEVEKKLYIKLFFELTLMVNQEMMIEQQNVIARLMTHAGRYSVFMILSWVFAAISGVALLSPYLCIYFVACELLGTAGDVSLINVQELTYWGWMAVKATGLAFMVYSISLLFSHLAAFNLIARLRIALIRHLGELPLGFHATHPSGRLRKIIDKNAEDLENFVAHQLPDTVQAVIMAITFVVSMVYFDWRLCLTCVIPIAAGTLVMNAMLKGESGNFLKRYQDALGDMSNAAVEYVRGVSVVKAFGQTVFSFQRFYNSIMAYKKFVTEYVLSMETPMSLYIAAVNGIFFLLIPAGIVFYQWSDNNKGFLFSFVFFIIFIPLAPLLMTRIAYRSSRQMLVVNALNTFDDLLGRVPLLQTPYPENPSGWDIVFEDVSFRYESRGAYALDHLSFTAREGTVTALVRPGAAKPR